MNMQPCGACGKPAPDFLLVNNDGLCPTCYEKVEKAAKKQQTLWAYEDLELEKGRN